MDDRRWGFSAPNATTAIKTVAAHDARPGVSCVVWRDSANMLIELVEDRVSLTLYHRNASATTVLLSPTPSGGTSPSPTTTMSCTKAVAIALLLYLPRSLPQMACAPLQKSPDMSRLYPSSLAEDSPSHHHHKLQAIMAPHTFRQKMCTLQ
jgi:hypothetical protein